MATTTRTIDRFVKRVRYAEFGMLEYWLLDPFEPHIEVLRLEREKYKVLGSFEPAVTLDSSTFPRLRLSISSL